MVGMVQECHKKKIEEIFLKEKNLKNMKKKEKLKKLKRKKKLWHYPGPYLPSENRIFQIGSAVWPHYSAHRHTFMYVCLCAE